MGSGNCEEVGKAEPKADTIVFDAGSREVCDDTAIGSQKVNLVDDVERLIG